MDVTITLSPADVAAFAKTFTQARGLAAYPETLFHEASTTWVEEAADDHTLNYGTCFWFTDPLGATLAKKVFEAAGETAYWLTNSDEDDSPLSTYPYHAILTSWDVWQAVQEYVPGRGYEPVIDTSIGDTVERWLNSSDA